MKHCNTCGQEKEENMFPQLTKTYIRKDGVLSVYVFTRGKCKKCTSEAMKRRMIETFFRV